MSRKQAIRAIPLLAGVLFSLLFLAPTTAQAAEGAPSQLALFPLATGLFGGLSLFLFGMDQASDALQAVAGSSMRRILDRLITNRFMGLLTGVIVTAILQSSSVTTVMLVSFITAGLISFSQAIGVILGANIGTTITVQIIAFKVTRYALLLVTAGFALLFTQKGTRRSFGRWLMGIGLIFFGMSVMGDAMTPLRTYQPFLNTMAAISNPWYSLVIAALFTAVIQTSAATVGIAIVFASQGLITLETGIALILGANVGTCVTAGLAAIGKPPEAVRAAVAHVLFKVIGALIALPFIPQIAEIVVAISPKLAEGASNMVLQQQIVPRQIANAHTVFNVGIALLFLPFSSLFVRWVEWLVPDREDFGEMALRPRYLDDSLIDTPSLALGMVRREVNHVGDVLEQMLAGVPTALFRGDLEKMQEVQEMDEQVDALYASTTRYLAKIGQENLPESVADEVLAALTALTELEAIGDIIENNLAHLAHVRVENNVQITPESLAFLDEYHTRISKAFQSAIVAFVSNNTEIAEIVMGMKEEVNQADIQARAWQAMILQQSLTSAEMASYTLQMDIMDNFKRIYYHIKRVAKLVVHEEGAADWTHEQLLASAG